MVRGGPDGGEALNDEIFSMSHGREVIRKLRGEELSRRV